MDEELDEKKLKLEAQEKALADRSKAIDRELEEKTRQAQLQIVEEMQLKAKHQQDLNRSALGLRKKQNSKRKVLKSK